MNKFIVLVFILCTGFMFSYSQSSVFRLHAAIGDTIDKKEKADFDLFPELKNPDYKFGVIYSCGEIKKLHIHTQTDSIIVTPLDSSTIADSRSNINKLLDFYSTQIQKDTISDLNKRFLLYDLNNKNGSEQINLTVDKDAINKSAYEGRRKEHLRTRALLNGLSGQKVIDEQNYGGYGEIKFKKKKK